MVAARRSEPGLLRGVPRALLGRCLAGAKGPEAYDIDPAIDDVMARQILRYSAAKVARGMLVKPRLGASRGTLMIGRRVTITHPQMVRCGYGFVVEDDAELHGLCSDGLHFGNNVTVGRGAQIRPSGYYGRALGVGLVVGDNSNIGSSCYIGASGGIRIGRNVLMAAHVVVLSEEHRYQDAGLRIKSQGVVWKETVIEDDVWLGARCVILGGAHVGRGAVVAAGAVVKGDVEPFTVVAGVPARPVRQRHATAS
jgi:acetyltransferase-like isoleucine patch superfamily enzyme